MKKMLFAAAAALAAAMTAALPAPAQSYEPRDSWPYVYENFTGGTAMTAQDKVLASGPMNITISGGKLMYVDPETGKIMYADMTLVQSARIGEDGYVNVGGGLYRVLSSADQGSVLLGKEIDRDELGKVNIGYGISSSTASSANLTILLDGRGSNMTKTIAQSEAEKYSGMVIPVKETMYLYVKGQLVPAVKSELLSWPGLDKDKTKSFIKSAKIRWKDSASVARLLPYLNENL